MYDLKPLDAERSLSAYAALFARTFPGARLDEPYLRWLYLDNPEGAARGFDAYEADKLVAHYATIPVVARRDGAVRRGLLSLNTATDEGHRGKGLFTRLAESTYAAAAEAGLDFVVGVANANSTPGFIRKLGFQLVAPLHAKIGVGMPSAKTTTSTASFAREWSPTALAWRLKNPHQDYRVVRSGGHTYLSASTGKPGIRAILSDHAAPQALAKYHWPGMVLWLGLDPDVSFAKRAMFDVPQRLRPSPLNFIFRDLTSAQGRLDPATVRCWAIDFDAY